MVHYAEINPSTNEVLRVLFVIPKNGVNKI